MVDLVDLTKSFQNDLKEIVNRLQNLHFESYKNSKIIQDKDDVYLEILKLKEKQSVAKSPANNITNLDYCTQCNCLSRSCNILAHARLKTTISAKDFCMNCSKLKSNCKCNCKPIYMKNKHNSCSKCFQNKSACSCFRKEIQQNTGNSIETTNANDNLKILQDKFKRLDSSNNKAKDKQKELFCQIDFCWKDLDACVIKIINNNPSFNIYGEFYSFYVKESKITNELQQKIIKEKNVSDEIKTKYAISIQIQKEIKEKFEKILAAANNKKKIDNTQLEIEKNKQEIIVNNRIVNLSRGTQRDPNKDLNPAQKFPVVKANEEEKSVMLGRSQAKITSNNENKNLISQSSIDPTDNASNLNLLDFLQRIEKTLPKELKVECQKFKNILLNRDKKQIKSLVKDYYKDTSSRTKDQIRHSTTLTGFKNSTSHNQTSDKNQNVFKIKSRKKNQ